jgi:hypothetical protein
VRAFIVADCLASAAPLIILARIILSFRSPVRGPANLCATADTAFAAFRRRARPLCIEGCRERKSRSHACDRNSPAWAISFCISLPIGVVTRKVLLGQSRGLTNRQTLVRIQPLSLAVPDRTDPSAGVDLSDGLARCGRASARGLLTNISALPAAPMIAPSMRIIVAAARGSANAAGRRTPKGGENSFLDRPLGTRGIRCCGLDVELRVP